MDLSHLSDADLLRYHTAYKAMMQRPRDEAIKRFSMDTKFAYHLVRLMCEVEQIMIEGDLDLERNREQLKAIRRGEWSLDQVEQWFEMKEQSLEEVYSTSTLRHSPDEDAIYNLLYKCLEQHYGSMENVVRTLPPAEKLLAEMQAVLDRYR